ncbi:hypothetical protein A5320_19940 [Rheinheimera sp. SA_1]|uniref:hypothetical protein n=1 Tax=Rheinheimera sp. SA_1 TaxID=1827365 RepID=UPI000800906A|nr:hypothetical protein [Rheinheimera sp. SA_1]OBP13121.1 hypothetical protein A5320_19940 [Rheinheimera sp. SA_1]
MNKDQVEAHSLFNSMQKTQVLLDEFEKLRPNWKGSIIRFASMLLGMAFILFMYPEVAQPPVSYVFLILIFGMNSELHSESKRINKRIDALHKLLKDDV